MKGTNLRTPEGPRGSYGTTGESLEQRDVGGHPFSVSLVDSSPPLPRHSPPPRSEFITVVQSRVSFLTFG